MYNIYIGLNMRKKISGIFFDTKKGIDKVDH